MATGLLGRKVGMTQLFDEDGRVVPVTLIQTGPCTVLQVKTSEKDGYAAIQLGFADMPRSRAKRPHRRHVAKANTEPKKFIREIRDADVDKFELGQELTVEVFNEITHVDVIGITKGKGFQGGMKRFGFRGKSASHGTKKCHRHIGSTGMSATPARVLKGTHMPGHMGNQRRTARHLRVVRVDKDKNLLVVQGTVPGANGGFLTIREAKKTSS